MVGVAKWLRQWVVVPSRAGSNPVAHPLRLAIVLNSSNC